MSDHSPLATRHLSLVVIGASGDLARRKIFPALFALYCQDLLPANFNIFGFARTGFSDEQFRRKIMENLACRYTPGESCAEKMDEFLGRCFYVSGQYGSEDSMLDLYEVMRGKEAGKDVNRMFYLAVPPSVFMDVVHAIGDAGFVMCGEAEPWSRVVVEKPFGKDRKSSDKLTKELSQVFSEDQTYRIDHYLGKEVVQNLMALRFANLIFEPIWNSEFVERVDICWKEKNGLEGRAGYFDEYGIIRDVMQNHLLQILALVAMEPPAKLEPARIMEEKVKVLRRIPAPGVNDIVVGQYSATKSGDKSGYLAESGVSAGSITPTYASVSLGINNHRWKGVPFVMRAGKALDESMTEIRIKFRAVTGNIFCDEGGCPEANELVVRIQPDEAIYLRVINKVPGLGMRFDTKELDLRYKAAFDEIIPDAYESLLLDVIEGDKSLFIWSDELKAAWDIFTPILREIEQRQIKPVSYKFGGDGPEDKF